MALQIRRGLEAQRANITPAVGELVFTTDQKKLYIGDGSTVGGVVVDTTDYGNAQVAQYLPTYSGNISNLTVTGTLTVSTVSGLANVATTGDYTDLSNTPTLANVATSGSYSDLSGAPTLANVATTGDYADLSNAYGNTEVGSYLPTHSGNVGGLFTGNVDFTMANVTHWTSNVFTVADALNQLAARIWAIENP